MDTTLWKRHFLTSDAGIGASRRKPELYFELLKEFTAWGIGILVKRRRETVYRVDLLVNEHVTVNGHFFISY